MILSLLTESVWWGEPPHHLSVIGSVLVTFLVHHQSGAVLTPHHIRDPLLLYHKDTANPGALGVLNCVFMVQKSRVFQRIWTDQNAPL